MSPSQSSESLLTIEQVARFLKVSKRTIYRWIAQRRLPPPLRYSRVCLRWRQQDLKEHLNNLGEKNSTELAEKPKQ